MADNVIAFRCSSVVGVVGAILIDGAVLIIRVSNFTNRRDY